MGQITLENVSKELGGRTVLHELNLTLNSSEVVGLVGANGSGKTTLFRLLTGEIAPDTGQVGRSRGMPVGYLSQTPSLPGDQTLFEAVAGAFAHVHRLHERQKQVSEQMSHTPPGPELERLMAEFDKLHARLLADGGYDFEVRVYEILGGLGFKNSDVDLPVSALSGGQQCRAALAKLLLQENTFLLLDEPTNHLDIQAVQWLEKFLSNHEGGAAIISHDRYLLDRVASQILELDRGQITAFGGNYTSYLKERDVRRKTQARQYEQDQAFIAKERAFIDKHMGKQRTAEAKGRRTRLERRLAAGEFETQLPGARRELSLDLGVDHQLTGWIIDVQRLAKAYDGKELFRDVTFQVLADTRLGVTGPNGTGKSTLLRILLEQVDADTGQIRRDPKLAVGYFAQDAGFTEPEQQVLAWLMERYPYFSDGQARNKLAQFLFVGDDVFKQIKQLSGGERARLRLLDLLMQRPNTLILDEPTNHLDIPSREALEAALSEFDGAIIVVSHDRYFLDRICSRMLVLEHNEHTLVHGNYSAYRAAKEAAASEQNQKTAKAKRQKQVARKVSQPKSRWARHSLEEIEALIHEHETALDEINARFGETEIYSDPERLAALQAELDEKKAELVELHTEWEAKMEAAES